MNPAIQDRYLAVVEKVFKHSKFPESVKIVCVSKKQTMESILEAYEAGARHFGENYFQEALNKLNNPLLEKLDVSWHFVGSLQTNKLAKIVPRFDFLHSIDQQTQLKKLEKLTPAGEASPSLLVQINISGEESKSGIKIADLKTFFSWISENTHLSISGLMTFPPYQIDPESNRRYFAELSRIQQRVNDWNLSRIQLQELSMGVSHDFTVALEEGATIIRVGESVFGPR